MLLLTSSHAACDRRCQVKTAATEATALAKAVCHRGQQRAARVRVWSARVKVY